MRERHVPGVSPEKLRLSAERALSMIQDAGDACVEPLTVVLGAREAAALVMQLRSCPTAQTIDAIASGAIFAQAVRDRIRDGPDGLPPPQVPV